jgi:hypothetical protein
MTSLPNEIDVLRDVCGRLEGAGIPYMLTGSLAMNYYAVPRMTRDIDVVVELQGKDVARLAALFADAYYLSEVAVARAVASERMFNIIHTEAVIKVDFIVRKSSEYRRVEFARRRKVALADFSAFLVSREDLVLSKLVWARGSGSELQLRDVRNLLAEACDEAYLTQWAQSLGVGELLEECRP